MRLTVHIPDEIKDELKRAAQNEQKSMSALVSKALRFYLHEQRKQALGQKVLDMVNPYDVAHDAHEELEKGRDDDPYWL
jgi:metal-responsive CopG/Arc/MetJ family transcriptional regulator